MKKGQKISDYRSSVDIWNDRFHKIPCDGKVEIIGLCKDCYDVKYNFGKYGSRYTDLTEEELQSFYNKLDDMYKVYHSIVFAFKCDSLYMDELRNEVNEMVFNEKYTELSEFMNNYIPKTKLDDPFGRRLCWARISSISEYCYAFQCERLRNICDKIGNIKNKYCDVEFDCSNASYPRFTLINDLSFSEWNPIEMTLYSTICKYLEHNHFMDKNDHLQKYWCLPKEKIDTIIKDHIKRLKLRDLILSWK